MPGNRYSVGGGCINSGGRLGNEGHGAVTICGVDAHALRNTGKQRLAIRSNRRIGGLEFNRDLLVDG